MPIWRARKDFARAFHQTVRSEDSGAKVEESSPPCQKIDRRVVT
jgi:hypothetical protein